MATTVLMTKVAEGENKIPDVSGLVTNTYYKNGEVGNKISDQAKYIPTSEILISWFNIWYNKYETKIVNTYIVHDLDKWRRNPFNSYAFKNWLFGVTNLVQNTNKSKYGYSGYGIAFDGAGSWNFGNDFTMNNFLY